MRFAMPIPEPLRTIMLRLDSCGHRADIVGGCVRDFLLGDAPKDYDVTTDATPDEVILALSEYRVIETGLKHGTVTVIAEGEPYEITTYRIDGEYTDARHPTSVTFTKRLGDDLARRDFTMNALAYNERDGLTDLYGGVADIESRIIRAVGEPEKRFTEDALRILRALRFSSVLGFEIEKGTADAMHLCRELINRVSAERIYSEFTKLICGKNALCVIREYREVLRAAIPQLPDSEAVKSAEAFHAADIATRLAALFWNSDIQKLSEMMKRLRSDNKTARRAEEILSLRGADLGSKISVRRLCSLHGEDIVRALADAIQICGDSCDRELVFSVLSEDTPHKISQLCINGSDLLSLGICGERVGEMLAKLLDAVMSEKLPNEREALLAFVAKNV